MHRTCGLWSEQEISESLQPQLCYATFLWMTNVGEAIFTVNLLTLWSEEEASEAVISAGTNAVGSMFTVELGISRKNGRDYEGKSKYTIFLFLAFRCLVCLCVCGGVCPTEVYKVFKDHLRCWWTVCVMVVAAWLLKGKHFPQLATRKQTWQQTMWNVVIWIGERKECFCVLYHFFFSEAEIKNTQVAAWCDGELHGGTNHYSTIVIC